MTKLKKLISKKWSHSPCLTAGVVVSFGTTPRFLSISKCLKMGSIQAWALIKGNFYELFNSTDTYNYKIFEFCYKVPLRAIIIVSSH